MPSRMRADSVTASFGKHSELTGIVGVGNAEIEETAANGTRQTTRGDRLTAEFAPAKRVKARELYGGATQIAQATVEGHVVLVEKPAQKPGENPESAMRATAERAVYDGTSEWLHLYGDPRVKDGALQLAAKRIDVSQTTGEAQAQGDVKATWLGGAASSRNVADGLTLGGEGPTHVVATEAELQSKTDEATFRGKARLWQDANSIAAPVIVLDRKGQTLRAKGDGAKEPVRVVLVGLTGPEGKQAGQRKSAAATAVIRIHGDELEYAAAKRRVVMTGGASGDVVAETADGTTRAKEITLDLVQPGSRNGASGAAAQVERMMARGQVKISAAGREGTGEELVYTGSTGEYVLTGSSSVPPRLTDPAHGSVTGAALIFNSHDDSVRIEGEGRKTTTETTAPRRAHKQR